MRQRCAHEIKSRIAIAKAGFNKMKALLATNWIRI